MKREQPVKIFEYKCIERIVKGKRITLKFVRDDSVPYIDELKKDLSESTAKFIENLNKALNKRK